MADLLPMFARHLTALCPDWPRKRLLAAFSGGLDSVALVRLLALSAVPGLVTLAHLNHRLRGEESDRDQRFAAQVAAELGFSFLSAEVEVAALARRRKKGLEEAARRARYDFLAQALEESRSDCLLTAHQADDQAETVLLNLIKGAGGAGLAGISPRRPFGRGELLRPLLPFSRRVLKAWLEGQPSARWMEDASNRDPRFLRNRLRLEILPLLEELNPAMKEALNRTALLRREEEDFWAAHLQTLWNQALAASEGTRAVLVLRRSFLESLSGAERRRLIHEALIRLWRNRPNPPEPVGFESSAQILEMLRQKRHRGLDLPGGLRAEVDGDGVTLSLASRLRSAEKKAPL